MRLLACRILLAAAILGWPPGVGLSARAQSSVNPGQLRHADAAGVAPAPPSASLKSKPPVTLFRELLAMDLGERQKASAERSPEKRRLILAKVREYESLPPDVRVLRLRKGTQMVSLAAHDPGADESFRQAGTNPA